MYCRYYDFGTFRAGAGVLALHTGILMGLTGAFQDFSFEIQLNLEYLASNRLVRHQGGG